MMFQVQLLKQQGSRVMPATDAIDAGLGKHVNGQILFVTVAEGVSV